MKILILFLAFSHACFGQNETGSIVGTVIDQDGEALPFVKVLVYSTEVSSEGIKGGAITDFDGTFRITYLGEGWYDLKIIGEEYGMDSLFLTQIEVRNDQISVLGKLRLQLNTLEIIYCDFGLSPEGIHALEMDPFGRSITIESEGIKRN